MLREYSRIYLLLMSTIVRQTALISLDQMGITLIFFGSSGGWR